MKLISINKLYMSNSVESVEITKKDIVDENQAKPKKQLTPAKAQALKKLHEARQKANLQNKLVKEMIEERKLKEIIQPQEDYVYEPKEQRKRKVVDEEENNTLNYLLVAVGVLAVGGGFYYFNKMNQKPNNPKQELTLMNTLLKSQNDIKNQFSQLVEKQKPKDNSDIEMKEIKQIVDPQSFAGNVQMNRPMNLIKKNIEPREVKMPKFG